MSLESMTSSWQTEEVSHDDVIDSKLMSFSHDDILILSKSRLWPRLLQQCWSALHLHKRSNALGKTPGFLKLWTSTEVWIVSTWAMSTASSWAGIFQTKTQTQLSIRLAKRRWISNFVKLALFVAHSRVQRTKQQTNQTNMCGRTHHIATLPQGHTRKPTFVASMNTVMIVS